MDVQHAPAGARSLTCDHPARPARRDLFDGSLVRTITESGQRRPPQHCRGSAGDHRICDRLGRLPRHCSTKLPAVSKAHQIAGGVATSATWIRSRRVAAAFPRMQERRRLRLLAGGHLQLVHLECLGADPRVVAIRESRWRGSRYAGQLTRGLSRRTGWSVRDNRRCRAGTSRCGERRCDLQRSVVRLFAVFGGVGLALDGPRRRDARSG